MGGETSYFNRNSAHHCWGVRGGLDTRKVKLPGAGAPQGAVENSREDALCTRAQDTSVYACLEALFSSADSDFLCPRVGRLPESAPSLCQAAPGDALDRE